MGKFAIVIATGLTLLAAPAMACTTEKELAAQILEHYPDAKVMLHTGDVADSITAGLKTLVGKHYGPGRKFIAAVRPGVPAVYLAMFENGCAVKEGVFEIKKYKLWIGATASAGAAGR